ncbi:MAG TPA: PASTA domain-containing protein [Thermoleophilia bacterium]|nr:PASTA domain-containing protein [Thermoleophilia bacterium]
MSEPLYAQRYRLTETLPSGRAVAVHRAEDAGGRSVRITIVRPADPDAFMRRMGVVAAARHLDLPAVLDIGQDGDDVYVVTEDMHGEDAAGLVRGGPLPISVTTMLAAEAAAGLAALHSHGAVHGGIEPEAIVQVGDGTVKLCGAGLGGAYLPPDLRPGAPAGPARYLSPEEIQGRPADPASDVYRLGSVLYLLLTGAHVFDGADAAIVAREHLDGVVQPPQLRNPEVPPAIAQIVLRTLDKDPARRGTAAQLQQDLSGVLGAARVQVAPPEKAKGSGWIWVVGAVVVVLAALGIAWAAGVFDSEPTVKQVAVPNLVGMTEQGATTALEQAGLKVGKVTSELTDKGPAGTVVAQDPAAGQEVAEGGLVALTVSTGASPSPTPTSAVPNVVGTTEAVAVQNLEGAGFVAVIAKEASLTPAGQVVSQSPTAGVMAASGSNVTITVSTGPAVEPTSSPSP